VIVGDRRFLFSFPLWRDVHANDSLLRTVSTRTCFHSSRTSLEGKFGRWSTRR